MIRTFGQKTIKIHQAKKYAQDDWISWTKKEKVYSYGKNEIMSSKKNNRESIKLKKEVWIEEQIKQMFTFMTKKGDLVLQRERQRIS